MATDPELAAFDVRPHAVASGVYRCRWQLFDAVLVEADRAAPCWRLLGDVLITAARVDATAAIDAARALARDCPGCVVVAVPVGGDRTVAIWSAGQIAVTRCPAGGAVETALRRYGQLVTGPN